ncbi:hypothetical protein Acor_56310 [Acrocarpospora corrugata]|uniref:Uncharacterized protein n=1 Tax=Acrocarpospora corrugata TaxID=35763 RepID=A0A5M3W3E9_9ACTN|nr:hypothetical protein [Acrocarpospora corrugata]GES03565.1 hypothetical protein Acor_56310 [Acrocarpospora corrugata]
MPLHGAPDMTAHRQEPVPESDTDAIAEVLDLKGVPHARARLRDAGALIFHRLEPAEDQRRQACGLAGVPRTDCLHLLMDLPADLPTVWGAETHP